ncbi:reverse transcriptase domain-containing protein [Tanacetum coccineum]
MSSLEALIKQHNKRARTPIVTPIRLTFHDDGHKGKGKDDGQSPRDGGDEDLKKPYNETLDGPARGWFDRMPNGCIDSWADLRERFSKRFALRRRCIKDPTKVSKIIRMANEMFPDFKERWTEEMGYIQGVLEVMQISTFMTNSKCPELARRFADRVPRTVTKMMQRVDDFVKSEEAYKSTKLPKGEQPERGHGTTFRGGRPPRLGHENRHQKTNDYGRRDHYQPYVPSQAQDWRYDTHTHDNRRQLEAALESGKLNHLVKDVRQRGNNRGRRPGNNNGRGRVINMVQEIGDCRKRKSWRIQPKAWMNAPITFPPVVANDVSNDPLIIEAEVEGYWVRRVFVDQGAAVQVMFEHCFDNLSPAIKSRLTPTQTELVGFSGEQLIPIRKVEAPSPYNIILGRMGMRELRVVSSTVHAMLKFPKPRGIATLIAQTAPVYECRWSDKKAVKLDEEIEGMIMDIAETFDNLRMINMKLNPKKCSFDVGEGKFLGYMVTSEVIRANPKKMKVVADMQSPKTLKEMQSLSGKLAALNPFALQIRGESSPVL